MLDVKQVESNLNTLIDKFNDLQMEIHQANIQHIVLDDEVYDRFEEIEKFLMSYIW